MKELYIKTVCKITSIVTLRLITLTPLKLLINTS
jgi:hypothetical protein